MELFDYLRQLAAHNERPWFAEHRERFDRVRQQWFADLDRMIAALACQRPELAHLTGQAITYRIYRDVRFSKDKSPYKTHFSAFVHPGGRKFHYLPGLYLHVSPAESGIYAGIWEPPTDELNKLRRAIVDNVDEWNQIMDDPAFAGPFSEWRSTMLKTMPKGWAKDHPMGFYLRMKDYGRFAPLDEAFFDNPDWPEQAAAIAAKAYPFLDFLTYSLEEDTTLPELRI